MSDLMLGEDSLIERATAVQAVAGTGALCLLAELLAVTGSGRKIYLGTPAFVNHAAIFEAAGLQVVEFPIAREGRIDMEAIVDHIRDRAFTG